MIGLVRASSFRTAASTAEQTVTSVPCRLFGVYPEVASTAGTITLRDGVAGTVKHICPIGTLGAGKTFGGSGVDFPNGLTVELSNTGDLSEIVWAAL